MCDYSLLHYPNRLAQEGEALVLHRFPSTSIGMISAPDWQVATAPIAGTQKGVWARLKEFFAAHEEMVIAAVCVPPGAQLLLQDIPERLQKELGVQAAEEVTFTQINAEVYSYRDAVRFRNGRECLLQKLKAGQRLQVLSLTLAEEVPQPMAWASERAMAIGVGRG